MTDQQTRPDLPDASLRSVGELLGDISSDLSTLLRQEVELARAELRQSADHAKAAGGLLAGAGVSAPPTRASRLKETVMGSAHDVTRAGSDTGHSASDTLMSAPDLARRQTRGNPLAAGAVALAAGWLVGSLLPASEKERQLASSAKEHATPLVDEAASLAQETAQHLKEPAQQAAQSVKETARDAATHVRDEGASAAHDVGRSTRAPSRHGFGRTAEG